MVSQESIQPFVHEVVKPMQTLADLTFVLRDEVSTDQVLLISSWESSGLWGMSVSSFTPHPSCRIVPFDWYNLAKQHLRSSAPFQMTVKVNFKILSMYNG